MATLDEIRTEVEAAMRQWDRIDELALRGLVDPGISQWALVEIREQLLELARHLIQIHNLSSQE